MKISDVISNLFSNKYIVLDRETSIISLSKTLYQAIEKEEKKKNPNCKPPYKASFWKIKDNGSIIYTFFVNPDWSARGVANPSMVFQSPILVDPDGHLSIKAMMPSVQEILTVYGIQGNKVKLKISVEHLNGEQYYLLKRDSYDVLAE